MDAHGPFTGVVRFVHAHVICKDKGMSGPSAESQGKVMCTYEHAEIVVLRYCRNVRPTWVEFNSKDTKESEWCFEVLSTKSKKRT